MTVKVVGNVNGIEVVFYKNMETGQWDAVVPRAMSGDYVLDIIAYDEAGNEAYTSKWLFIINANRTQAYVVPLKFNSETHEWDKYAAYVKNRRIVTTVKCERFRYEVRTQECAEVIPISNGG